MWGRLAAMVDFRRNLKVMFFETLFYLVLLHLGSDV